MTGIPSESNAKFQPPRGSGEGFPFCCSILWNSAALEAEAFSVSVKKSQSPSSLAFAGKCRVKNCFPTASRIPVSTTALVNSLPNNVAPINTRPLRPVK